MPTLNFFYQTDDRKSEIIAKIKECKKFAAKTLSCGDKQLTPEEISIRLLRAEGDGMIADVELEITAHAYETRVKDQDVICVKFRKYLMQHIQARDIQVWLLLPQLGHSWE